MSFAWALIYYTGAKPRFEGFSLLGTTRGKKLKSGQPHLFLGTCTNSTIVGSMIHFWLFGSATKRRVQDLLTSATKAQTTYRKPLRLQISGTPPQRGIYKLFSIYYKMKGFFYPHSCLNVNAKPIFQRHGTAHRCQVVLWAWCLAAYSRCRYATWTHVAFGSTLPHFAPPPSMTVASPISRLFTAPSSSIFCPKNQRGNWLTRESYLSCTTQVEVGKHANANN